MAILNLKDRDRTFFAFLSHFDLQQQCGVCANLYLE